MMVKKFSLFILGTLFLVKSDVIAMTSLEDEHPLSKSHFRSLPNENIVAIGEYLYGDDFHNFSLTCLPIRNILMAHKKFFIPENKEEIKKLIQKTSLYEIPNLILTFSRTPKKKAISQITMAMKGLERYSCIQKTIKKSTIKESSNKFKNYVKYINLLYGIGYKEAKKEHKKTYRRIQSLLCEERAEDDKVLYSFHLKNFSLLNKGTREAISKNYLEGQWPFEKNYKKANKYSVNLSLPLNNEMIE